MRHLSRRELLGTGGLTVIPARLWAQPPSNKLNLAFIGIGTNGARCLRELAPTQNVLAVCDVDWRKRSEMNTNSVVASEVVQQYPQARRFDDWRQMLDVLDREIDGVVIAGADHMHAIASIAAMRRGKQCLLRETPGAFGFGTPRYGRGRAEISGCHPNRCVRPCLGGLSPHCGMDPRWRHWQRQGSSPLDCASSRLFFERRRPATGPSAHP